MNIFSITLTIVLFWSLISFNNNHNKVSTKQIGYENSSFEINQKFYDIYSLCELDGKLDFNVFKKAIDGYNLLELSNKKVLSIIDFSKPSTKKRLFVIDIKNKKLLFHTYVAHGKNSGLNIPTRFSNRIGSLQSSLGFFRTAETYKGKHGYSLMLDGLEKGINDNARRRSIVMHGADYVSKNFIDKNNRLGRSWGCPAVSEKLAEKIIDVIKGGSCLFIYSDDKNYLDKSITLNTNNVSETQLN